MMIKLFKSIKCNICNKKFSDEFNKMNHEQIVHGKDTKYDCKECDRYFSSMEEMRTHLQREHTYKGRKKEK